jgi:2-keto-4-pentenoate hydratase/2-oxohepta-3-ene-1,7-dioic acid hydratase in catechol pathway
MRRFGRVEIAGGRRAFAELSADGRLALMSDAPWLGGAPTGEVIDAASARALAPVTPSKILCVGRNYRAHAKELGNEVPKEPLLFLKASSSLLDPDGAIELPPTDVSSRVDYEAEIALVVGKRARRVSREAAMDHVFGATLSFDVTARDLQKQDGQWTRAKGMDTFCPAGPHVVAGIEELGALTFTCSVNGEVRQRGDARDMIFAMDELVAYMSAFFTLEPGDLLLTGTPEGVGPLAAGDALEMTSPALGALRVRVAAGPR